MNLKVFFARLLFYLFIRLRLYANWSRIHRLLFDRVAANTELPTFGSFEEIQPFLLGMVWRPDSWIDLGDAICSPQMVWYRYLNDIDHKVGDCDEFAIWLTNVIAKSIKEGKWTLPVSDMYPGFPNLFTAIMTVTWIDGSGRTGGHNVCYLKQWIPAAERQWEKLESGCICMRIFRWGYLDYGRPHWYRSEEEVVRAIRHKYAGENNISLGWAIHEPNLSLSEVHWK